jgi:membrane-bound inhibitor of C-type lysozyme
LVSAYLEIAGASLWIVAAVAQLAVFRYELRVLREMRSRSGSPGAYGSGSHIDWTSITETVLKNDRHAERRKKIAEGVKRARGKGGK